ncbi:hypothetical protein P3X46_011582 [Hevea brasiliensis]|uniref:Uncharacterized protein n=1 Tax=Hevea brasiliensis TaxID=3981 RepID=A0ABQ9M9U8_HEVBR|nr:BAHD acyltransferase At5g47980-like [Hevea brasiliensis]KAJ9176247.1 hypothetical protein P3X46_011582 [Hevea brasiliensis]
MEINVEIITRETIKPFYPAAPLSNIKLSLMDQFSPAAYGSMVLFYFLNGSTNQHLTVAEISQRLKTSLSKTLTRFYPLAGRIKDNTIIECNDDGAVFVEARVDFSLEKFLEKPEARATRKFIPVETESSEAYTGTLLLVQATYFACGGLALGVCTSHKIVDASSVCTFMKGWAATAIGSGQEAELPLFNAAATFPPQNYLPFKRSSVNLKIDKCVTKIFVFEASKIAILQTKAASESVKRTTRVEAVTALIWRCATKASRSKSKHSKPSVLAQAVDIRRRMVPVMPEHTFGNLLGHFASRATVNDIELASLVVQMRKGMQDFNENYVKKLQTGNAFMAICESSKEIGSLLQGENIDFYITTSLCRYPFYGFDFGWGKPDWAISPRDAYKNIIALMDTRDGDGIEAWVTLAAEDMQFFEQDQELLSFASLNPGISNPLKPKITYA